MQTEGLQIVLTSQVSDAIKGLRSVTNAFDTLGTEAANALHDAEDAINDLASGTVSINRLTRALNVFRTAADNATDPTRLAQYNRSIQNLEAEINRLGQVGREADDSLGGVGDALGALGIGISVAGIVAFGKSVVETTAKYEAFQATLKNALGADEAERSFGLIKKFASETPFQVDEITGSFIKLVNRGFKPTADQLREIGDVAASQGKSFEQYVEAILDAQTGQFERLNEFGIKASAAGDKVTISFKGQTQVVEKNSTAVRDALLNLGEYEGVANSMAAVSETLGGKISNLSDSWDNFQAALGKNGLPLITATVEALAANLALLNDIVDEVGDRIRNDGGVGQLGKDTYDLASRRLASAKQKGETALRGELLLTRQDIEANNKQIEILVAQLANGVKGTFNQNQIQNKIDSLREQNRATESALKTFNDDANKKVDTTTFGGAKSTKNVKSLSDVLAKLDGDLKGLDVSFALTGDNVEKLTKDKIQVLTNAFKELANFGVLPGTEIFDKYKTVVDQLQSDIQKTPVNFKIPIVIEPLAPATNTAAIEGIMNGVKQKLPPILDQFTKDVNKLINDSLKEGLASVGVGIGDALTGGGLGAVLKSFVDVIANFGVKLGTQLIAQGVAIEAFNKSLQSLSGVTAIVAGVALIAASTAFKNLAGGGVKKYATGGVAEGTQLAIIGDNPGRKEAVIPSELWGKMGGSGDINVETRISANDLLILIKRAERNG